MFAVIFSKCTRSTWPNFTILRATNGTSFAGSSPMFYTCVCYHLAIFPHKGSRVFVMRSCKSQYVIKPLPAIVGFVRIVNVVCTTVITRLYPDTTMRVTSHYHKGVSFLLICSSTVCSEAYLVQEQINDQNTVVVICALKSRATARKSKSAKVYPRHYVRLYWP